MKLTPFTREHPEGLGKRWIFFPVKPLRPSQSGISNHT